MTEPATGASGRRSGRVRIARFGPLEVLAVLLPVLTVAALALVRPVDEPPVLLPPTAAPLSRTTLVCPSAVPRTGTVALANADGVRGELEIRLRADETQAIDGTARTGLKASYVAQAEGELAAGLVGTRYGDRAATACAAPQPEQWFTGVGAAAEHSSTLELVNPDGGPAVADVTVLGPDGPLEVPALRGVTVPGGRTLRFDLSEVVPSRDELALQVLVSRGRLGVHVVDEVDEVGRGVRTRDWLPAQGEPDTSAYLLGLGGKSGDRTLVVANPGDSEARVGIEVITKESQFAPADLDEIRVPPHSTKTVDLTELLADRATQGATGLVLDATTPVTAGLRTVARGDVSHAVAGGRIVERAALSLPSGPSRLVLGGADGVGVATYVVRDEDGAEIARERVELTPGVGTRIKLPSDGALLDLSVQRSSIIAAVEVGPPGLAVLPLSELVVDARVPDVRPALR
ncbi:MAG: hypothetical protein JWN68_3480 [Nocardioides sp.]|jgi:hypothetical protein|uniref:DUF5719 family protein n=1 Tax=Nocardioides sp. TaxID=35761 RepID=UPI0026325993|nr:DUF5719 family protein [Nocardioides sp.]MCW2835527.1 hypothetical protein [Nocardioides sp.]